MANEDDKTCPLTGADICELSALKTAVQGVRSDLKLMGDKVMTHDRTLFGNGKVGMKEGYDKMTVKVGALLWLNGALVLALLGNLIALITGAYK